MISYDEGHLTTLRIELLNCMVGFLLRRAHKHKHNCCEDAHKKGIPPRYSKTRWLTYAYPYAYAYSSAFSLDININISTSTSTRRSKTYVIERARLVSQFLEVIIITHAHILTLDYL